MTTYVTQRIWQIRGTKIYGDEEVDFLIMCCRSLELAEMYVRDCPDKSLYIDSTYELVSIREDDDALKPANNILPMQGMIPNTRVEGDIIPLLTAEQWEQIRLEMDKHEKEYNAKWEAYELLHNHCPKCFSKNKFTTTLVATHGDKDTNRSTCNVCGWEGIVHDQISEAEANAKFNELISYKNTSFSYDPDIKPLGSEYIRTIYSIKHHPDGTSIIFHGSGEMP